MVRISLPLDVLRSNVSPFWASTDTFQRSARFVLGPDAVSLNTPTDVFPNR